MSKINAKLNDAQLKCAQKVILGLMLRDVRKIDYDAMDRLLREACIKAHVAIPESSIALWDALEFDLCCFMNHPMVHLPDFFKPKERYIWIKQTLHRGKWVDKERSPEA